MPAKPLTTHGSVDAAACARPRVRQPGLDLLRALAIVLVVLYHGGIFGFTLPGEVQRFGWVGVDLFFVLSGYLIGGQLLAHLASGKRLDLPRFFGRRALRILPAYLAVLVVYAALPGWREYPSMPPTWRFLTFVQNLGLHGGTAFSHAWSLCVEAQFYLALPFLLLAVVPRRRGGLVLAGAVILAGVALRAALAHLNLRDGAMPGRAFQTLIYYPTWTRLDPLVFGVGLAGLERFRPRGWTRLTDAAPWLWMPGIGLIAFGLWLGESDLTVGVCAWQFPLIAAGMATLLVGALSPRLSGFGDGRSHLTQICREPLCGIRRREDWFGNSPGPSPRRSTAHPANKLLLTAVLEWSFTHVPCSFPRRHRGARAWPRHLEDG